MSEQWREIPGFPKYEASTQGRIRNAKTGKILRPGDSGRGYEHVCLSKDGKSHSIAVHRLVAAAWIPNPQNLPEINHLDYNRRNNAAANLEWTTHRANVLYSRERMKVPKKEVHNSTGERWIYRNMGRFMVLRLGKNYGRYDTIEQAKHRRDRLWPQYFNPTTATSASSAEA